MTIHTSNPSTVPIPALRARVKGRVITPADPDYDEARAVYYGGYDRHPAALVRVTDAADVAAVIAVARETGCELAIRSGGHSNAGHSTVEGGLVLDLSAMRAIEIDPAARTAWAEPGLTAAEFVTATHEHGLGLGFGDTGSVAIGGITLGGGVGYLARKYGLTIDSLTAADLVTADGQFHHVDAATEPDLFWAIRGGGGNFGVVTRLYYRLYPVGTVVGGMMLLPATPEVIAGFIAASEAAPEELTTIANIMPMPPMPFVPPDQHGQLGLMGMFVCLGNPEAGQRAIAPFRALATPLVDMVHPMPYPAIYVEEALTEHLAAVARTMFIDKVDPPVAQTIVEHLKTGQAMMNVAQLRVLGGAVARVPNDATAYAHRQSRIMVNVAAVYRDPADGPQHAPWVAAFAAALHQGDDGAYVNFLTDEGAARVHAAYPGPTWDRLAAIKACYDPTNLFHLNQNIPPASNPVNGH